MKKFAFPGTEDRYGMSRHDFFMAAVIPALITKATGTLNNKQLAKDASKLAGAMEMQSDKGDQV